MIMRQPSDFERPLDNHDVGTDALHSADGLSKPKGPQASVSQAILLQRFCLNWYNLHFQPLFPADESEIHQLAYKSFGKKPVNVIHT